MNIWREVAEAKAGLVVNCDVQEVSRALFALLQDPTSAKAMGQRGRLLVKERFTWETVGDQLVQVYRKVIAK